MSNTSLMYKKSFLCIFVVFSILFLAGLAYFFVFNIKTTYAQQTTSFLFINTLRLGQTSPDIRELQKFLNKDPQTAIASFGIGSSDQETAYFCALTYKAVIKFQNKYASEVLFPTGLSSGTGFVGPATLKKLNALVSNSGIVKNPVNNQIISPILPITPTTNSVDIYKATGADLIDIYETDKKIKNIQDTLTARMNESLRDQKAPDISDILNMSPNSLSRVFISGISSSHAKSGTRITVGGKGFTPLNNVYFGKEYILKDVQASGEGISFTVPALPFGKYDVVIKNSNGISNTVYVIISAQGTTQVFIDSTQPLKVSYGDTLTIRGRGFTSNNDIITSMGTFKGISSADGKTISFRVEPPSFAEIFKIEKKQREFPNSIRIVNNNGISEPSTFIFVY